MSEVPVNMEQQEGSGGQEPLSLMDKAAGIFYEPTKVFDSLKKFPVKFADWFVPVLLVSLLVGVNVYVRFSSPDLRFQAAAQQGRYFDKMVEQGKMSADQAQQAKDRMENPSTGIVAISVFAGVVVVFIFFFIIALIWFLVGRFALKAEMSYTHAMGIVGVTNWIGVVGVIVATVVMVAMSRLDGGLHLGLLTQMDTESKAYLFMTKADVFSIWTMILIALGLGRFSGKRSAMPYIWVFGLWVVWVLVSVFVLGGRFG